MVAGADGAERAVYSGEEAWRCAQPPSGGAWDNPEEAKSRRVDSMASGRRRHGGGTPVAAGAAAAKCQAASFASYALVSLVYCAWFLEWFIIF